MNCKACKYIEGGPARVSWGVGSRCKKCDGVVPPSPWIECVCGGMSEEGYHIFWFRTPLVCDCGNPLKKIFVPCHNLTLNLNSMVNAEVFDE